MTVVWKRSVFCVTYCVTFLTRWRNLTSTCQIRPKWADMTVTAAKSWRQRNLQLLTVQLHSLPGQENCVVRFQSFILFCFDCLSKQVSNVIDVMHLRADCRRTWLASYIRVVNDLRRWPLHIVYVLVHLGPEWSMTRTLSYIRVVTRVIHPGTAPQILIFLNPLHSSVLGHSCSLGPFFSRVTREPFTGWNFAGFHEPGEATSVLSFFFLVLFIS